MTKVCVLEISTKVYDSNNPFVTEFLNKIEIDTLEVIQDQNSNLSITCDNHHLIEEKLNYCLQFIKNKLSNNDPKADGDGTICTFYLSFDSKNDLDTDRTNNNLHIKRLEQIYKEN